MASTFASLFNLNLVNSLRLSFASFATENQDSFACTQMFYTPDVQLEKYEKGSKKIGYYVEREASADKQKIIHSWETTRVIYIDSH